MNNDNARNTIFTSKKSITEQNVMRVSIAHYQEDNWKKLQNTFLLRGTTSFGFLFAEKILLLFSQ